MRLPIVLVALLSAGAARADDAATARTLFKEGMALLEDGAIARACPKLAESSRLAPTLPTRLALAGCYDRLGRTASAWFEFKEAATMAGKDEKEWQREMYALERVKALEKKLVRLTVSVPSPTPGMVVKRNGLPLPAAEVGTAVVVDPGQFTISVDAAGYESWSKTVIVGKEPVTSVEVPELRKAATPPPADVPVS